MQHRNNHSHTSHHHSHTSHPVQGHALPDRRKAALLLVLLVAQLMVILDITAVNIALPSLAKDLQLSGSQISWTITSYSLVFGSLLLFGGRAADLLGRRRLFLTGLAAFTAASLASALAGSAATLFAARAGQGLGAAMLSPAALSIITSCFHGQAKAKALAAWGAVGGAGAAIGVLAGGLLTEFADWRMIFFVNLPVAVVLAVTALNVIPADGDKPRWRGLDLRGATLATASLGAIVYAITQGADAGWMSTQTVGLGLVGISGLVSFAVLETRTEKPLLKVRRLADRAVGGGPLPDARRRGIDLRTVLPLLGLSPERARHLAPADGPRLHPTRPGGGDRCSWSRTCRRTPWCADASRCSVRDRHGRHGAPRPRRRGRQLSAQRPTGMLVAGFGLGIAVVSVSIAILTGTREDESGMISGLNSTGHEIGGTIGIAVFSTIAAGASGAFGAAHAASAISHAFVAAGILTSLASLIAFTVLPHARDFVPKLRLNPIAIPAH